MTTPINHQALCLALITQISVCYWSPVIITITLHQSPPLFESEASPEASFLTSASWDCIFL